MLDADSAVAVAVEAADVGDPESPKLAAAEVAAVSLEAGRKVALIHSPVRRSFAGPTLEER